LQTDIERTSVLLSHREDKSHTIFFPVNSSLQGCL
jgi:hypothetical protein